MMVKVVRLLVGHQPILTQIQVKAQPNIMVLLIVLLAAVTQRILLAKHILGQKLGLFGQIQMASYIDGPIEAFDFL